MTLSVRATAARISRGLWTGSIATSKSIMSSLVNPLDRGSVAKFQTRADAVFGSLGGEEATSQLESNSGWQLKKEQVFRSGKEAEDASSEEEAEEPGQQLVTGLNFDSLQCIYRLGLFGLMLL